MCDKENICEYFSILKIPCDDCKYKEQDADRLMRKLYYQTHKEE